MPELEAKIKIPPSTSNSTTSGISHHFFSCRANSRNSLNRRHIVTCTLENARFAWQAQTDVHSSAAGPIHESVGDEREESLVAPLAAELLRLLTPQQRGRLVRVFQASFFKTMRTRRPRSFLSAMVLLLD